MPRYGPACTGRRPGRTALPCPDRPDPAPAQTRGADQRVSAVSIKHQVNGDSRVFDQYRHPVPPARRPLLKAKTRIAVWSSGRSVLGDRAHPGFWSGCWRAYVPVTRRDPDAASRVCHGVEQIERLGTTDQPTLVAARQHGLRVDVSETSAPREIDGWLVIAHESPVWVVSLEHIDGLCLAEMKRRRVGARRAKAAPDLIDSDKRFDVVASRHRLT